MKKIAVFTDFPSADSSYSLNIVAEEQLGMLAAAGYKPVGIVEEGFQPERNWQHAELRFLPQVEKSNNLRWPDDWEARVQAIQDRLNDGILDDVDVVITHDLIYQSSLVYHNIACRRYAKDHPNVKWLNWIHSATSSQVWRSDREGINTHFPNSKTIFPNEYSKPRIVSNFKAAVDDVVCVPHTTDPFSFLGVSKTVKQFAEEKMLLDSDVIMVYPVRLDRGKQVEFVIDTVSALKRKGKQARLVVVDFHSTGGDKVEYRNYLKNYAVELGLNEAEVSFTSEYFPIWQHSVPREDVRSLFQLASVFMLPSKSETYSLIAQEAALCGNFLVLNFDFPPIRSVYGEAAGYFKFSSGIDGLSGMDGETTTSYPEGKELFFDEVAARIVYELDHNNVLRQKVRTLKERSPGAVFRKYYEPLFHSWDG
jgi:glycosyltransferase involved in cell wall biosynthesis